MKKMLFMFAVISLCGSFALGFTTMGPPNNGARRGQFIAGIDHSYSQMDIRMHHGRTSSGGPSITLDNLHKHTLLANLIYGVRDNCEISFRVGGGAARDKEPGGYTYRTASPTLGNGYIVGFGTKATFIRRANTRWGGLFQVIWVRADGRARTLSSCGYYTYSWSTRTSYREIQIAIGPTWQLNQRASIYGGPFFHILDGRFSAKQRGGSGTMRYHLKQGSVFGGYVGTEIIVTRNGVFRIEYQHTAAGDAVCMSLLFGVN